MSRLNEKDLELLQTGQTVNLSTVENAYYGGEFTTNPNDCVEVLIYDTNENLLETSIVDVSDYSYNYETGVKLNTGTILRKMGYDRGKYVVKYNFLRKIAGSYETVLVDSDGRIFNGTNYHIMDNGKIMSGETHTDFSKELFLKEYKYFVHEISPSRKEIRLAPQSINDSEYLTSFLEAQVTSKKITIPQDNSLSFYADRDALKGDSKTMKLSGDISQLTQQMIGGYVSIDNAFIKEFLPPPVSTDGSQTPGATEELESSIIQARFFISNDSLASYEYGDRNLTRLVEVFTGLSDTDYPTDVGTAKTIIGNTTVAQKATQLANTLGGIKFSGYDDIVYKRKEENISNIQELQKKGGRVQYTWQGPDSPNTITLKSNSSKPNVATKYTWELTGWDYDSNPKDYSRITAWSSSNTKGDVEFVEPSAEISSPLKLIIDSSNGSEVTIRLHQKHLNVGVKLTIEPKDGQPSTLHIPAFISVG